MLFAAVPAVILFKEQHVLAATARALDTVRPAPSN
jgi:hypothetical protein